MPGQRIVLDCSTALATTAHAAAHLLRSAAMVLAASTAALALTDVYAPGAAHARGRAQCHAYGDAARRDGDRGTVWEGLCRRLQRQRAREHRRIGHRCRHRTRPPVNCRLPGSRQQRRRAHRRRRAGGRRLAPITRLRRHSANAYTHAVRSSERVRRTNHVGAQALQLAHLASARAAWRQHHHLVWFVRPRGRPEYDLRRHRSRRRWYAGADCTTAGQAA